MTSPREFVAMVAHRGGTQAVTINANSKADAERRLLAMGYDRVVWCEPN